MGKYWKLSILYTKTSWLWTSAGKSAFRLHTGVIRSIWEIQTVRTECAVLVIWINILWPILRTPICRWMVLSPMNYTRATMVSLLLKDSQRDSTKKVNKIQNHRHACANKSKGFQILTTRKNPIHFITFFHPLLIFDFRVLRKVLMRWTLHACVSIDKGGYDWRQYLVQNTKHLFLWLLKFKPN